MDYLAKLSVYVTVWFKIVRIYARRVPCIHRQKRLDDLVPKFSQLVEIWQSFDKKYVCTVFWDTVYIAWCSILYPLKYRYFPTTLPRTLNFTLSLLSASLSDRISATITSCNCCQWVLQFLLDHSISHSVIISCRIEFSIKILRLRVVSCYCLECLQLCQMMA